MLLENIHSSSDVKKLSEQDFIRLAVEIRNFLIENVSKTGGHLAPSLGVVELTLAIHKVFNLPTDKVIWDVGHQSYVHKILTGRKEQFPTLRQYGGLSGFPKRCESEYDVFDTGHSSTSISAAVGMARARDLLGQEGEVIAVIGDGAMTGGMAFEAMNNAGHSDLDITVILNDNEMSISENVGGLSSHLRNLRMAPAYTNLKVETRELLSSIPKVGSKLTNYVHRLKTGVKVMLTDGMIFEGLGYQYYGPVDGHNISQLIQTLEMSKAVKGPKLIHVITKKGKGYMPAENKPDLFHGISPFDIKTGETASKKAISFSKVFGNKLVDLAEKNDRVVAITAAMEQGTGLSEFKKAFPNRFFDVGIAEQHAVTMAAGLAVSGMKPVVAVYSTFLQRAFDQIIHDVCIQNLDVVFAVDRAGLVGNDGETHHGTFDLNYFGSMPNMMVLSPKDGDELSSMLQYALLEHSGPIAIRYPRGSAELTKDIAHRFLDDNEEISSEQITKPELLKQGKDGMIISVGNMLSMAFDVSDELASRNLDYAIVNARCVHPISQGSWNELLKNSNTDKIITIEDGMLSAGFGNRLESFVHKFTSDAKVLSFGIPDVFVPQGDIAILRQSIGLTAPDISQSIMNTFYK